MKPRPPVTEEAAGRDVEMVDAELGERNAGLEEEDCLLYTSDAADE